MKKIYASIIMSAFLFSLRSFAQCSTPSVVPYFESFQGITANNQLPPCWAVSNTLTCLTYSTGSKYASFNYTPAGDNYFYSNAVQLQAGITYSMVSFFRISFSSSTWTNFSMHIGPNQSTTGLVPIVSTNSTVAGIVYTPITNTFVVSSSGIYYAAVKGTSNGLGATPLFWEDLSITIPCTNGYNSPAITIVASSPSVCSGNKVTILANGADTYTWNTGATISSFTDMPSTNITYAVNGTNTLTGCSASAAISIIVKPSPIISLIPSAIAVCLGSSVNLNAVGGPAVFAWSNGQQGSFIAPTPTANTIYMVTGINSYNCLGTASVQINVNPLPVISVANSGTAICPGQQLTLFATGADSYQWFTNAVPLSGSQILYTPSTSSTTFNVVGTDLNNCVSSLKYVLKIGACVGLEEVFNTAQQISIYPNPGTGEFNLISNNAEFKNIVVSDMVGKIVFSASGTNENTLITLDNVSNGIYLVKISMGASVDNLKIVKQ